MTLLYSFLVATFFAIFLPLFLPFLKLIFYAPCLVFLFLNTNFIFSLYVSCLFGLIIDVFSSDHIGIHALLYSICCCIFFKQKKFFKNTPLNIAIFTFIIASTYTLLNIIVNYFFYKPINITLPWLFTDLIAMSILDGLYALIFFAYPIKILNLILKNE